MTRSRYCFLCGSSAQLPDNLRNIHYGAAAVGHVAGDQNSEGELENDSDEMTHLLGVHREFDKERCLPSIDEDDWEWLKDCVVVYGNYVSPPGRLDNGVFIVESNGTRRKLNCFWYNGEGAVAHRLCLRVAATWGGVPLDRQYEVLWDGNGNSFLPDFVVSLNHPAPLDNEPQVSTGRLLSEADIKGSWEGLIKDVDYRGSTGEYDVPDHYYYFKTGHDEFVARPDKFPAITLKTTLCATVTTLDSVWRLPHELCLTVFDYLPDRDLLALGATCRAWYTRVRDQSRWFKRCMQHGWLPTPGDEHPTAEPVRAAMLAKSKYDWCAFYAACHQSLQMRARRRLYYVLQEMRSRLEAVQPCEQSDTILP
ncbi:hypothetical protein RI367_001626 [Sorochytrium milnesiophthora]